MSEAANAASVKRQMANLIGRTGTLRVGMRKRMAIGVDILVVDTRYLFGRVECLVEPVAGVGRAWYARPSLTLNPKKTTNQ